MEWRTYTPDGRVLAVRQTETGWAVACNGAEVEGAGLADAIRDVVSAEPGNALLLHPEGRATLEHWVVEAAARIERDVGVAG